MQPGSNDGTLGEYILRRREEGLEQIRVPGGAKRGETGGRESCDGARAGGRRGEIVVSSPVISGGRHLALGKWGPAWCSYREIAEVRMTEFGG